MLAGWVTSVRAADDFAGAVDLSEIRAISVQHNQTLKTFDSFARQAISAITGRQTLDGREPSFTLLDMAFDPKAYRDRKIIKIRHVPLREEFRALEYLTDAEKDQIVKDGRISLSFWEDERVQRLMGRVQATATHKADAVQQLAGAAGAMQSICRSMPMFPGVAMIAPATTDKADHIWHTLDDVMGNVPAVVQFHSEHSLSPPPVLAGYSAAQGASFGELVVLAHDVMKEWRDKNASAVNTNLRKLALAVPQVNPEVYPSSLKRRAEVMYNRLAKLTIPGVMFYFAAFVCLLISTRAGVTRLRLWGLRLFLIAFAIHTLAIGVRWWLVEKSVGNWFDAIPIKNQFESVMFSAWFGALLGLILELHRSRGIFATAASFVGWLSLLALFATPYVAGKEIGAEIGQVQGVLMSYWLYIHVTLVTASYALISMGFALGVWWLIRYYRAYGTIRKVPARQLSSDAGDFDAGLSTGMGGAVSLGFARTLAMLFFVPAPADARPVSRTASNVAETRVTETAPFLATLDLCNLVVLQLAFWILGLGIVCGAIWADESWGRPWGWDPKETFALVTWIVYLIVVHTRIATKDKAWWTAVLAVIGFFIMLVNWIGVNFFLVGLHSYA